MCVLHSIRFLLRPATSGGRFPPFVRTMQGWCKANANQVYLSLLSRSPHSQSISLMLCKGTTFFVRFQIPRPPMCENLLICRNNTFSEAKHYICEA